MWSRSEKIMARKAFDAALKRDLHEVMQEAKQMASQVQQPSDLWDLEHYLTERRKDINRKYDTRGSRLKDVMGRVLYENRIGEHDLRGLGDEKMESIRSFAQFLRDDAACSTGTSSKPSCLACRLGLASNLFSLSLADSSPTKEKQNDGENSMPFLC
jgi:hypothetical protein